jgi:hypothetical protein
LKEKNLVDGVNNVVTDNFLQLLFDVLLQLAELGIEKKNLGEIKIQI